MERQHTRDLGLLYLELVLLGLLDYEGKFVNRLYFGDEAAHVPQNVPWRKRARGGT